MIYTACYEQAPDRNSISDQLGRQRDHASLGRMGAAAHRRFSLDHPYDRRRYVRTESGEIRLQEALRRESLSWTGRTQTGLSMGIWSASTSFGRPARRARMVDHPVAGVLQRPSDLGHIPVRATFGRDRSRNHQLPIVPLVSIRPCVSGGDTYHPVYRELADTISDRLRG